METVLKSLPIGKATGPDLINNRLLKELAESLSFPLCERFNFSLAKGKFPSIWKQANVTPVFKKNDPSCRSNYRPISLLSAAGKVLEKIVFKYLLNFFRDHQVITTLQSGFIPGDSTVNQLVDIYNTFCKGLDEGLDLLEMYCHKWGLQVNTDKTKIVVFRKRGGLLNDESWTYNGRNLEVVSNFNYLGTVFNYTGNFALNQETLVGKGLKAMNCLLHNTKRYSFKPCVSFK